MNMTYVEPIKFQNNAISSIYVASIEATSIVDGPGLRMVIFAQGCPHRCPGCHNPSTHLQWGGTWIPDEQIVEQFVSNSMLSGVTFSGGEPFLQASACARMAKKLKLEGASIVTYTGYRLEYLRSQANEQNAYEALLAETDLLIDGLYIEKLRNLDLFYRGSENQRLIALSPIGEEMLFELTS